MNAIFKVGTTRLDGERIILRKFIESDLDEFYAYASVDGVGQPAGWWPHQNIEESKMILDMFIRDDKTFAIINKETGKLMGSVGIELLNDKDLIASPKLGRELGYVLGKDYWNKGYMTEVVKLVTNYCFKTLHFDFLCIGCFVSNAKSQNVALKCGYKLYSKTIFKTHYNTFEDNENLILYNE
ncbi:MAG: GNAT family N-acetyltransferase [Bacilli bacterium]